MSIARSFSLLPPFLLLVSCVTINVYFPAAAAEKAADKIIEHVLGEDSKKAEEAPPARPDSSQNQYSPQYSPANPMSWLIGVLDFLISDAHAAADIDISSPAINQLQASMQGRHTRLSKYYKAGAIGYSADGLVAGRDLSAVGLRERGAVKKLLAQENRDRNALYRELARANGHPEWEAQIRDTFARRWVAKAPRGWYYRDRSGSWHQK